MVAAEFIAVGRDDLEDELMTEEQLSKRYKNSDAEDVEGGGIGGGEAAGGGAGDSSKDEDLKTVLATCMAELFEGKIEEMIKLQDPVTTHLEASSERAEKRGVVQPRGPRKRWMLLKKKVASGFAKFGGSV